MLKKHTLNFVLNRKQFNNWLFRILKGFLLFSFFDLFHIPKYVLAGEVNEEDLSATSTSIVKEWIQINRKYGKEISKEDQEKIKKKTEEAGKEILEEKGYTIEAPTNLRIINVDP